MKRFAIGLAFAAAAIPAAAGEVADGTVAQVLGTGAVTHTTQTHTRYGMTYSDVTYRDAVGVLFTLRLGTPEQFEMWKQASAGHSKPVPGVGSEAFRMDVVRSVCARGTGSAACATPDPLRKVPKISDEQLADLTKAAL